MKYNRFWRILAIAAVFSLLMIVLPATPALAAAVTLTPNEGEVGDHIKIEGSDFGGSTEVHIYFSSQEAEVNDFIDDEVTAYERVRTGIYVYPQGDPEAGQFDTSFNVPDELTDGDETEVVHGGEYYVYTTYSSSGKIKTKDDFTVIGIEMLLPDSGPVDTNVQIDGFGFDRYEDIFIEYDDVETEIVSGDEQADSRGDFTCYINIPESTAGVHTITAADESGHEGEAKFVVEPDIDLSSFSGAIDDEVTVNGTGFGEELDVTITFGGTQVAADGTNDLGSFDASFNVPDVAPGPYEVVAEDEHGNTAEVEFSITTNLTASPLYTQVSPGHVGAQVTLSGVGFGAGVTITITYASDPEVFTTTSLGDGSFTFVLTIPPSLAGPHTITATDGNVSMTVAFYMESTPPSTPQPLLPLMDGKLEDWKFDWGDVTDLSAPVAYDLQIATDEQFTDILLEKTGLATSEYTLTEEEELESTSEEAPYYWRVRAVDAASNASGWTGAAAFQVGSSFFELEGWKLYTLIGIGAVVIFFLGFWIGRRTIPEYY